ncbi:WXG100-like domain-containing protein [Rhodococcus tibetensis]|uniref:Outer membrane channel protein CpnT-like N-terminal domain-containing protein n=1 Tax=Rhodococcus tibetensis TaxID=2965064 RepID=A0ABT1QDS2_9NOCA|nr:hypothetical protein [Rhodococcus sp. FXJ9.536]MCQ4120426.1 hypothetical protein [Rhodococcus sp. FXJ9.536]
MGIELPEVVKPVAWLASGSDWPATDETSLRRLADAWGIASTGLMNLAEEGDAAMRDALCAVEGDVATAMSQHWQKFGGDTGALRDLAAHCETLSATCESTATEVEYAKLSIIAALAILLAELGAMAAAAVPTLGASTAGAVAAEAATQVTIRMIIRDLIVSVIEHAAVAAAQSVALDGGIQALQIVTGGRNGFDADMLKNSLIGGATDGAISALFGESWVDAYGAASRR